MSKTVIIYKTKYNNTKNIIMEENNLKLSKFISSNLQSTPSNIILDFTLSI